MLCQWASGSGGACVGSIFGADDRDFKDGGITGSGVVVYVGSSSDADGSGHVSCQAKFLVMVQVMVRIVL